jgi:RNA polymerase sigma-70 factor (ECF subfamily)
LRSGLFDLYWKAPVFPGGGAALLEAIFCRQPLNGIYEKSERGEGSNGLSWCTCNMNVELVSRTAATEWADLLGREAAREPETAFALLVERQSRFVFQIAYAVLRNVEDAEDVAQDTFLKLFRTGAWKQMQDERRFLARMAWRLAVGRVSAKRSVLKYESRELVSEESSPEEAYMVAERRQTIHRLIDALPEKLRRPLALSSIQEMTTPEIAAVMDLPEGTVRRLLVEARTLVKEKMSRMEGHNHA